MNEIKEKKRAERNRTLTISDNERVKFSQKIMRIDNISSLQIDDIINKTIHGEIGRAHV